MRCCEAGERLWQAASAPAMAAGRRGARITAETHRTHHRLHRMDDLRGLKQHELHCGARRVHAGHLLVDTREAEAAVVWM